MSGRPLHLFQGCGIELEYMIVEQESLAVLPVADRVLAAKAGSLVSEVEAGPITWSNELVLHVIELKTTDPRPQLQGLAGLMIDHVREINAILAPLQGRLMPTAMHPFMDPLRDTVLWPHSSSEIYAEYDRLFGCRKHGWANLQSMHINLPFADDEEFGKLHAAIRLLLPILPALAAASPIVEGRITGFADTRLEVYRTNQKLVPEVTGRVIPEQAYSRAAYEKMVLAPMYRAIAPFDSKRILQQEWLNSRGAIARFSRQSIEIRLLDIQECPAADLAIAAAVIAAVKAGVEERWASTARQMSWPEPPLEAILLRTIQAGERAVIDDADYLAMFGYQGRSCAASELWFHLVETLDPVDGDQTLEGALATILRRGPLARRIMAALGGRSEAETMTTVFRQLCSCLAEGEMLIV